MKTKFLLITIFLFPFIANAQWESMGDDIIPVNHRVWSIKIAPDESIWAISTLDDFPPIGQVPKVHRSVDSGTTFTTTEISAALDAYGWDISPVDSNMAFVALDTAGLYQTVDGGVNWNKVQNYEYRPFYIHFFNSDDGWILAADSSGFLVMSVTSNGGDSWAHISYNFGQPVGTSLPPIDSLESVLPFTFSVNSAYDYTDESIILGTTKGTYFLSTDKGYNWTRNQSPLTDLGLLASNIAMKDTNTFVIAGDVIASNFMGSPTKSFSTTDGGNTWTEGNPGVTAAATHYLPESDSIFIMVGHNNFGWGSEGTAISYDYGVTWNQLDLTSLIAIDFIDQNTGVGSCCNNGWPTANGQIHKWNFELPTSIKELAAKSTIKLTPNPVSANLFVQLENQFGQSELYFEILNGNGQVIQTGKSAPTNQLEVDVSNLAKGFYVLKIENENKVASQKFLKH